MENTESQNFIDHYQEALDNTPEEVRSFLWSDAYRGIISGIAKTCGLTAQQEAVVSDVVFDIAIGAVEEGEIETKFTEAGITTQQQQQVLDFAMEYIIEPSATEAENLVEGEYGSEKSSPDETAPITSVSPSDVLANLGARLSQSSVIVPSKRDYSVVKSQEPSIETLKPSLDPYRELPEK